MPKNKTDPQAGEGTIKVIFVEHTYATVMVRIRTIHDNCQGLWDEGRDEVNENLFCRKFTARPGLIRLPSPRSILGSIKSCYTACD